MKTTTTKSADRPMNRRLAAMSAPPSSDLPALPDKTGICLCGCGTESSKKSYFAPGHDHRLQGFLVHAAFGGTAGLAMQFAHLIPQGGPPNRKEEQEAKKAARAEAAVAKPVDAVVVDTKPADAKPKGGPGSGGVPKVKAAKSPKVTVNPALTSDERSKLGLKNSTKSSKKGGK